MDATRSADQLHAALLRRSWPVWKPPPQTKNPAPDGTGSGAVFETTSQPDNTPNPPASQANFARAARIDRAADQHLSEGRGTLAEFLANRAEELRAVPA